MGAVVNLGTIDINSTDAGGGTNDGAGDIEIAAIGTTSASGASGAVAVGNTATDIITLDGLVYNTDSTQTYTAESGFSIDLKPGDASSKTIDFITSNDTVAFATAGVSLYGDSTHTIDTGTGAGDVTFGGAIQSGDHGDNDVLIIKSGTGDVSITGTIGLAVDSELGGLKINAGESTDSSDDKDGNITISAAIGGAPAGDNDEPGVIGITKIGNDATEDLNFGGALYSFDGATTITAASGNTIDVAVDAEFATVTDAITFATGTIELADTVDLQVNSSGGAITIDSIASVEGTGAETVTINAGGVDSGTETVRLGNVGDSGHTQIHNLTVTADDGITLTGAIYTAQDGTAATVTFNDAVIIDGDVIIDTDDTAHDGNITFTTSIEGKGDGGNESLTIQGGSGTITLTAIGATTTVGNLTINTQNTGTANLAIQNIGSGTVNATTVVGAGTVTIGNTSSGTIDFEGTIYKTSGAFTVTAKANATTDKEIQFSGASPFISTAGANVTLEGGEVIIENGTLTIDSNTNDATNGGNITIEKKVYGTSDESLVLDAHATGTGTIALGPVGHATPASSEIASVKATAGGGITLNGDITLSDAPATDGVTFASAVTIGDGKSITITTDSGHATADGKVQFDSTLSGVETSGITGTAESLSIVSGC